MHTILGILVTLNGMTPAYQLRLTLMGPSDQADNIVTRLYATRDECGRAGWRWDERLRAADPLYSGEFLFTCNPIHVLQPITEVRNHR